MPDQMIQASVLPQIAQIPSGTPIHKKSCEESTIKGSGPDEMRVQHFRIPRCELHWVVEDPRQR